MSTSPTPPPPQGIVTQFFRFASSGSYEMIPVLLFALYVIGYLCLNTHLSRYPIFETNIISFNYIKASLIFLIFNLPLISISRKLAYEIFDNRILSNLIIFLFMIDAYCFFIFLYQYFSIDLIDELIQAEKIRWIWILACMYIPVFMAIAFYNSKNTYLLIIFLLAVLVHIVLFCTKSNVCLALVVYITLVTATCFFIFFVDIHKSILYTNNKSLIIPIYGFVLAIIIIGFGGFVYDKIPQVLGGGKSYNATIFLTKSEMQALQESCILSNDKFIKNQVKIIYSSDKSVYIYEGGSVVIIPVDCVKGINVKRHFWFNSAM